MALQLMVIFNVLSDSISSMKQYMSEPNYNLAEIKIKNFPNSEQSKLVNIFNIPP